MIQTVAALGALRQIAASAYMKETSGSCAKLRTKIPEGPRSSRCQIHCPSRLRACVLTRTRSPRPRQRFQHAQEDQHPTPGAR